MLTEWLLPDEAEGFTAQHFWKAPCARPFAALDTVPLLGWDTVDRVLGSERPLDVLTVADGREVRVARPRSRDDVARLMASGVSVVVHAAEAHDPGIAALAERFDQALPGEVHVQLHITPAGTNSGRWHYDSEDAFVVQTAGVKDYYFRANTIARDAAPGELRQEASPLLATRLIAGDWLYLPARWWNLVKCVENSLSISVSSSSTADDDDGRSWHARNQPRPS